MFLNAAMGTAAFAGFFPRAFVSDWRKPVDGFALTGPGTLFARLGQHQVRFVEDASAALGLTDGSTTRSPISRGSSPRVASSFSRRRSTATANVRDVSCRGKQFHRRSEAHRQASSTRPALCRRDQSRTGVFESSDLLRRFGLIPVNADGFDLREVSCPRAQNVQALANSTTPQVRRLWHRLQYHGRYPNPPERLGWGNDAPPLRDFALVAIAQHAPTTWQPHVRSRLPCAYRRELDAMAAYQLSLGRRRTSTFRRWN